MNSTIETIYLRFQVNEIGTHKLCKYFPTCIQGQKSYRILNCKKHTLQLYAIKEFKVSEILNKIVYKIHKILNIENTLNKTIYKKI